MSEHTAYEKLVSLRTKGCIDILSTERAGRRIHLKLPNEIAGIVPEKASAIPIVCLEDVDFFSTPENRLLILQREGNRCFYCLRTLTTQNYAIEHVVSRPKGDNSYRNLVAACLECNNRKNNAEVEVFLRALYRRSLLTATELEDRLSKLARLKNGELKPLLSLVR